MSDLTVRIESGGTGMDSKIMLGDLDISRIVRRVTWDCAAGEVARASVELMPPEVDVRGLLDWGNVEELYRRCAEALGLQIMETT